MVEEGVVITSSSGLGGKQQAQRGLACISGERNLPLCQDGCRAWREAGAIERTPPAFLFPT